MKERNKRMLKQIKMGLDTIFALQWNGFPKFLALVSMIVELDKFAMIYSSPVPGDGMQMSEG